NRFENDAGGGRRDNETQLGRLNQSHESEKRNRHERNREDQKLFAREGCEQPSEPARVKALDLAVALHLPTLEQIAHHGASDDHTKQQPRGSHSSPAVCGRPRLTRTIPATINRVPAQRSGVMCSFRKNKPSSDVAT